MTGVCSGGTSTLPFRKAEVHHAVHTELGPYAEWVAALYPSLKPPRGDITSQKFPTPFYRTKF